jgi:hypothetical protein
VLVDTGTVSEMSSVLRLLAHEGRLRAFAVVVRDAAHTDEVAEKVGVNGQEALRLLSRLEQGGLVARTPAGSWRARPECLLETVVAAAAEAAAARKLADHGAGDPVEAAVLRTFLPEGSLLRLPARESKRRIVLDRNAQAFEPGVRYSEKEVDDSLTTVFADYVTLRRYLVDHGFLGREAGEYWRTGGRVAV